MFEMNFSRFNVSYGNSSSITSFKDIGIPADFYRNDPFILRAMLYRNEINMNTFILVVGNPRTSKSYCSMKLCEMYLERLGKDFNVEDQLTFDDVRKFLMWSSKAKESAFILDETGTSLSPDMFFSLQQRIMRRFVQTQGFRKNILFWVLPSIVFIQKGFRFMSNYAIRTIRQGNAEVYKIVVNQLTGKGYPSGVETLLYSYPKVETCKIYEEMKNNWNDEELRGDIAFLDKIESDNLRQFTVKNGLLF